MAIRVDVVAELNERAAAAAATRLRAQMARAGTTSGAAFNAALQAEAARASIATDRLRAEMERQLGAHGRSAGQHFGSGFSSQLTRSLPGVSGFASMMSGYDTRAGAAGALAGRALGMAFTAAAGGLLGAAAYTLFKGFERYEALDAATHRLQNLSRTMQATGQVGIDIAGVMKTVNDVVAGTPIAINEAMGAVTVALGSGIKQGPQLQRYLTDIADAAGYSGRSFSELALVFGQIQAKGRLMGEETLQLMEKNIPIAAWMKDTFKLTADQFEEMQSKGQITLRAVQKAIEQHAGGMAKAMGETIEGSIQNMKTSIARLGANFLGALFGDPSQNNTLTESLKHITDRLNDIGKWVNAHKSEIRDFFVDTAKVIQDVYNWIKDVVNKLGGLGPAVRDVAAAFAIWETIKGISFVSGALSTVITSLATITTAAPSAAGAIALGFTAILAPIAAVAAAAVALDRVLTSLDLSKFEIPGSALWGAHVLWEGFANGNWSLNPATSGKKPDPKAPAAAGASPPLPNWNPGPGQRPKSWDPTSGGWVDAQTFTPGPGMDALFWDPSGGWVDQFGKPAVGAGGDDGGPDFQDPRGGKDKKPTLPKAPVVPYDTALPPGFENLPMSSSLYSAESSFLDSRHKLAEKRARLAQLESDGNATAQDVLDARNDVIQAQRDQQSSELRLYEAKADIFSKQTKQMKSWLSELGVIGASLDNDFGISKGLAGIAENVTKFIANLAAAPLLGKLAASQMAAGYKPGEAGQGIFGMLGLSGAFGAQYQGPGSIATALQQQAAAGGAAGAMGAYSGDAALLAGVPAGRYSQEPGESDLTKGLGDCSSAVEDLVNIMDGRPTAGRAMSTFNGADWLTTHGFVPGMGGLGDFRVGFNGGHMQATLPGGTPFNWGSDPAARQRGIGGTGADDPALTSHYYRPSGGAGGPVAAAPAPAAPARPAPAAPAPGGGGGGKPVGPGTATQWQTLADGSKKGLDASGNATGDYIPPPAPAPAPSIPPGLPFVPGITPSGNGGGSLRVSPAGMGGPGGVPLSPGGTQPDQVDPHKPILGTAWVPAPGMATLWQSPSGEWVDENGNPWFDPNKPGGPGGVPLSPGGTQPGTPHLPPGTPHLGGPGPGLPGLPGTSNPTRIGGVPQPQGKGSGVGGVGGLPAAAGMAAVGAMTGGLGAAGAQSMMQLVNRTIQFGGQLVGIGAQGLMETFLPSGSDLGNNSWLTKIAGAAAGASPMLPNIAGKGDDTGEPTPEQVVGQGQGLDGRPAGIGDIGAQNVDNSNNSKNVTNNNTFNVANMNENSMAKTVAQHSEAQYA